MPFYNFYSFPLTQIFYDLLDIFSQLFIDYFSTVLRCKNTVSYTHLDVYKRQPPAAGASCLKGATWPG